MNAFTHTPAYSKPNDEPKQILLFRIYDIHHCVWHDCSKISRDVASPAAHEFFLQMVEHCDNDNVDIVPSRRSPLDDGLYYNRRMVTPVSISE